MNEMKFGNWIVSENGIRWDGDNRFHSLNQNIPFDIFFANRDGGFDRALHIAGRAGMTADEIYALNTAIMYAIGRYELNISPNATIYNTIIQEREILHL